MEDVECLFSVEVVSDVHSCMKVRCLDLIIFLSWSVLVCPVCVLCFRSALMLPFEQKRVIKQGLPVDYFIMFARDP